MQIDKLNLLEQVRKEQTSQRFVHTLGVQYTAACLAMKHEYSIERAEIAGILHDCAKCISDNKMLEECKKYNIPISDMEQKAPYLLHGKLGAYYAKEKYNIEDEEILSAITYHTTGKPNMTLIEKIVFIADYIEPNRKKVPRLDEIRKISFENMDLAMYLILNQTLSYLEEKKQGIDSLTKKACEYYKEVW